MKSLTSHRRALSGSVSLLAVLLSLAGCGKSGNADFNSVAAPQGDLEYITYASDAAREGDTRPGYENKNPDGSDKAADTASAPVAAPSDNAAPGSFRRLRLNHIGNLRELFNDSNKYQYAVAERLGIAPISDLAGAYYTRRPLVEIKSCELYEVDTLTHSMPFLVPEAEALLSKIGQNFNDSLRRRGGNGYRIRVTSVLRTPATVKRLRRINRNATDSSTHQFATTFDITYSRFHCFDPSHPISDGDLKNLLAEVLLDLRRQGKCLVKFERHSPCFHITATGK